MNLSTFQRSQVLYQFDSLFDFWNQNIGVAWHFGSEVCSKGKHKIEAYKPTALSLLLLCKQYNDRPINDKRKWLE